MKKALLIAVSFALAACASSPDPSEFMDLSCAELSMVAQSRQGSDLAERADMFNDLAREQERVASGSPFQRSDISLTKKGGPDAAQMRRDKAAIRAAYNEKGCQG